jgi:hypothetical protein
MVSVTAPTQKATRERGLKEEEETNASPGAAEVGYKTMDAFAGKECSRQRFGRLKHLP